MSDLNKPWQMPLDEAMQKAATYSERHKDAPSVSRTLLAEIERLHKVERMYEIKAAISSMNRISLRTATQATEWKTKAQGYNDLFTQENARACVAEARLAELNSNILREVSSEWQTDMGANTVTCHSRVVEGVLCRWWGDGPTPKGVSLIDAAMQAADAQKDKP